MYTKAAFETLPIVITSMSRWDGALSSASLSLAKVLSKKNSVFYIDYPYSIADVWRERKQIHLKKRLPALIRGKDSVKSIRELSDTFYAVTPKATLPVFSLPEGRAYEKASHFNNLQLSKAIKKALKKHNIKDYLFINSFNPTYLSQVERYLKPILSIYHSRDAIEEVKGHGLRKENECAKHYDLLMATSRQLCANIAARNGKNVNYFPNGGDIQLFQTALTEPLPKPKELESIHTPLVGYTGALAQREDYELIEKMAKAHPDKTFVFIGPRTDHLHTTIRLEELPNVLLTGPKPITELPAYLRHFDCTIIPFLKNNLTGGIYPLKINEYLAAGKSVVTTDFSEDIRSFAQHVHIAENHDQFIKMIDLAVKDNSELQKQNRLEIARSNSWEERMNLFWDLAWNAYQNKKKI